MNKSIIAIIAALFVSHFLFSQTQNVKVDWTEEKDKQKYISFEDVLYRDADGFFIGYENELSRMSAGKNTGVIERYDNSMRLVYSKDLIVRFHDNEAAYFETVALTDKFYFFTTFWDNKERVKYFLSNPISKNGDLEGEPRVLFEAPAAGRSAPGIVMRKSFNKTKIMLYTDLKDEKGEEESYYFKTFDQDLNVIWENKIVLPYDSRNFSIERTLVDDNANVHILGKVTVPRKEREKGDPSFFYTLISYFHASKEIKEFIPDVGDAYASGIGIKNDKEGNIIATGFFSEKSENSLKGVFYMKINPITRTVVTQKAKAFDEEFLSLFMSQRKASKGQELYSYTIDHIEIDDLGNTVVLAEQYYVQVYTSTNSSGQTTTRYVYNYNHILAVKYSPTGDVLWWTKIPKLQRSSDFTYYSYMFAMKNNGTIYILYNDHEKNIDEANPEKLYTLGRAKDAITVLVSIDSNGKVSKESMFEAKDDEGVTIFKPRTAKYLSKSEYLVLSTRGKKYKIGKVAF